MNNWSVSGSWLQLVTVQTSTSATAGFCATDSVEMRVSLLTAKLYWVPSEKPVWLSTNPTAPTAWSSPLPAMSTGVPQPELGGELEQATVSGTPGLCVRGFSTLVTCGTPA